MIYLITGLMASGKSTVAELLAQRFPRAVHLRGDLFRRAIVSGREEMCEAPSPEAVRQLDLRHALTAETAKRYHRAGFTVVVQDNYYGERLAHILELLEPEPVQAVVLCPRADVIQQRELQRRKTGYTGFSVDNLHRAFMASTPRIGLWIDNSVQTPRETAEQVWREAVLQRPAPEPPATTGTSNRDD